MIGDIFNLDRALTPSDRRRLRGGTWAKGYAAPTGTGPAVETCGTCDHLVRKRLAKVYRKCGLMERHWTGGKGTDVLATAPACRNWTAIESRKDLSGQNEFLFISEGQGGNARATKEELPSSKGDSIPSNSQIKGSRL